MALKQASTTIARILMFRHAIETFPHLYHRWTEPTLCALRKPRLPTFGCTGSPSAATIDLAANCTCDTCVPMVTEALSIHRKYEVNTGIRRSFSPTGAFINHDAWPTYSSYEQAIAKTGKGSNTRAARNAQRHGIAVSEINRNGWLASIAEIERSKIFRSGGIMIPALFKKGTNLIDNKNAPENSQCPLHWRRMWGAFLPLADGTQKLIMIHGLWRIGSMVKSFEFMCHGDYFRLGTTKFMFLNRMRWLLDREDLYSQGIRYHMYGAIEHGNQGLAEWKRRMKFEPRTIVFE